MVASYVSVVFYSCSPAQQLLLVRQLTAEEVHAAHGSGLTWVSPTSKIVPWPRGIVNPQDKLYLVQASKLDVYNRCGFERSLSMAGVLTCRTAKSLRAASSTALWMPQNLLQSYCGPLPGYVS